MPSIKDFRGLRKKFSRAQSSTMEKAVQNSSLKNRHFIERLFWMIIIFCGVCGAVFCCLQQWYRFKRNPIVVSLERDYRNWNGLFPGMTLCFEERSDDEKVKLYVQRKWGIDEMDKKFEYYEKFIWAVANLSTDNFDAFADFEWDKSLDNFDYIGVVQQVHPANDISLLMFDIEKDYHLHEIVSEKGLCFSMNTINTALAVRDVRGQESAKLISCSFAKNKCYFKIYVFNARVHVAVHSPYEVVTESTVFVPVEKTNLIYTTYKMLETVVADDVRSLEQSQRKCIFYDEPSYEMEFYSVTLCMMRCKARIAMELCNCKPYFYHNDPGVNCNPAGYLCLKRNNFPKDQVKRCKCPETCTEYNYLRNSLKLSNWRKQHDIKVVQKSSFRLEIISAKMRIRREVLFSFDDLLVSFGGAATLFLGFSSIDIARWVLRLILNCLDFVQKRVLNQKSKI